MRHPTQKELTALRLLADNPDGLLGVQLVRESGGGIRQGSVYFILDRLAQEGYVSAKPEPPPPGYGGKLAFEFNNRSRRSNCFKERVTERSGYQV